MNDIVEYQELTDYDEYPILEEVQVDTWNFPEREIVPRRIFYATRNSGGVVIVARLNNEIIGYTWGWVGRTKTNKIFIYSHHNAVRRLYQDKGIGYQLKLEQRKWAIENGHEIISWTFDPLQSKNGYLNLHKLGAICNIYKTRYWGEMHDDYNIGIDTDRFYCNWNIKSTHVMKRLEGEFSDYSKQINKMDNHAIHTIQEEKYLKITSINLEISNDIIFVEIPFNFVEMSSENKEYAKQWRHRTRDVFVKYFSRGYSVFDFIIQKDNKSMRCFHVLCKLEKEQQH